MSTAASAAAVVNIVDAVDIFVVPEPATGSSSLSAANRRDVGYAKLFVAYQFVLVGINAQGRQYGCCWCVVVVIVDGVVVESAA